MSEPLCKHRPACDGCPAFERYLQPESWSTLKALTLSHGLSFYEELAALTPDALLGAPKTLAYRNRARLVVDAQAEHVDQLWGFYIQGSRAILPIERCLVHGDEVEQTLEALRALLWSSPLRAVCRFVEVRALAGQSVVVLCLRPPADAAQGVTALESFEAQAHELAVALAAQLPELRLGLALSLGGHAQAILSGDIKTIYGDCALYIEQDIDQVAASDEARQSIPVGAFYQLNHSQLKRTHELMRQWLGAPATRIMELYCGIGTHALALSAPGAQIWGADNHAGAIEAARHNAKAAGLVGEFAVIEDQAMLPWLHETLATAKPELVLLNPARAGVYAPVLEAISSNIEPNARLLYLSCEPATLRRDLARLVRMGWTIERICPIDMMPRTDQVETLALLRAPAAPPTRVMEEAWWPTAGRTFSEGVSGPLGWPAQQEAQLSIWYALVTGKSPVQGRLPKLKGVNGEQPVMHVKRLHYSRHASALEIACEGADEALLRQRLRAWGFPVLGDANFGDRRKNALFAKHAYADRIALHCISLSNPSHKFERAVPGVFEEWLSRL